MEECVNNLYKKLDSYKNSDYYGFHMPGHKRNRNIIEAEIPYEIDITEIEGFDDLHHANGILQRAQERAARVFHAEESHFLINGSTVGILSAILGCTQRGDRILMARNCHKSVYHAVYMNGLEPIYVYPRIYTHDLNGEVDQNEIYRILKENEDNSGKNRIKAIVIVSPTYDGVLSDVRKIAEIAHLYGIPLIVDEAHGAHFGFHPYFPENANKKGADVVIHSIHKTLPALTQTALLHINGQIVDRERIKKYLDILQSSSPSYVLMAGIDLCIDLLDSEKGKILFENYTKLLKDTREKLRKMKCLRLVEIENYDFSKIMISVKGTRYSGRQLYKKLLDEYHLQMEMASGSYVLAMTSIGDTKEGFERLVQALYAIDLELTNEKSMKCEKNLYEEKNEILRGRVSSEKEISVSGLPRLEWVYTSAEMDQIEKENIEKFCMLPWECCQGKISAEYAYIYPPGIPLIVPGERISEEVVLLIQKYRKMGFQIEGLKENGFIRVL